MVKKCIGKGGFGLVFHVTHTLDDQDYAVKVIKLPERCLLSRLYRFALLALFRACCTWCLHKTDGRAKTYVSTKCSKLETALVNAWECVYGNYYHMTGWKFQK